MQSLLNTLGHYNRVRAPHHAAQDKRQHRYGDDQTYHVYKHDQRSNRAKHDPYHALASVGVKRDPQHHLPPNMLPIATAHHGKYHTDSLTQPRDLQGNMRTVMEMSMGSYQ